MNLSLLPIIIIVIGTVHISSLQNTSFGELEYRNALRSITVIGEERLLLEEGKSCQPGQLKDNMVTKKRGFIDA